MNGTRKRILAYCDFPFETTGFARVARQILKRLSKEYEIDCIATYLQSPILVRDGITYYGSTSQYPQIMQMLQTGGYDVFWTLNNIGCHRELIEFLNKHSSVLQSKAFKWIAYMPIEQDYMNSYQFRGLENIDCVINYTEDQAKLFGEGIKKYGTELKVPVRTLVGAIHHGVDSIFKPIPEEEIVKNKQKLFRMLPNEMLIVNVNRYQYRKDLYATIRGFFEFVYRGEANSVGAKLYLHTPPITEAGNIALLVENAYNAGASHYVDWEKKVDVRSVILTKANQASVSDEFMNIIYNCADVVINTSYAEGWGLSITEAMACGTQVVAPIDGTMGYLLGVSEEIEDSKTRGIAYWRDTENRTVPYNCSDVSYPYNDHNEIAGALAECRIKPYADMETLKNAKSFVEEHSWEAITEQWVSVFKKVLS